MEVENSILRLRFAYAAVCKGKAVAVVDGIEGEDEVAPFHEDEHHEKGRDRQLASLPHEELLALVPFRRPEHAPGEPYHSVLLQVRVMLPLQPR